MAVRPEPLARPASAAAKAVSSSRIEPAQFLCAIFE